MKKIFSSKLFAGVFALVVAFGLVLHAVNAGQVEQDARGLTLDGQGQNIGVTNGSLAPTAGYGLVGTSSNDTASAGLVGEYVTALVNSAANVSLNTTTGANITSIALTAGDWDVQGVGDVLATSANATIFKVGISTSSGNLGTQDTYSQIYLPTTSANFTQNFVTPTVRVSIAANTTAYLVMNNTFSGGTEVGYGSIRARRVR